MTEDKGKCGCMCHKMMGVLTILFGATILAGSLGFMSQAMIGMVLPVIIILAGIKMMMGGVCNCCSKC